MSSVNRSRCQASAEVAFEISRINSRGWLGTEDPNLRLADATLVALIPVARLTMFRHSDVMADPPTTMLTIDYVLPKR